MFPQHFWCSYSRASVCIFRHDLRTVDALSCQSTLCAVQILVLLGRSNMCEVDTCLQVWHRGSICKMVTTSQYTHTNICFDQRYLHKRLAPSEGLEVVLMVGLTAESRHRGTDQCKGRAAILQHPPAPASLGESVNSSPPCSKIIRSPSSSRLP